MKNTLLRRLTICPWSIIVASLIAFGSQHASADTAVNPKMYMSPSDEYSLFIDPSSPSGKGAAVYRFSKENELVWEREHPFTICKAILTDDGITAGYAYTGGISVGGHHGTGYKGLAIVFLDANGDVLQRHPFKSAGHSFSVNSWAGSDCSAVTGIYHDKLADRFIVELPTDGDSPIVWWVYQLSSGNLIGEIAPEHPKRPENGVVRNVEAMIVPGTSLTLIHWVVMKFKSAGRSMSAAFSLLDPEGKEVWQLALPGEYDALGEDWHWYWDLAQPGIHQIEAGDHTVSIRSYSESARMEFVLKKAAENNSYWRVIEKQRTDDKLPIGRAATQTVEWNQVTLNRLDPIRLEQSIAGETVIGEIINYAFDASGNIGFIRREPQGKGVRFVRVRSNGDVLTNVLIDNTRTESVLSIRTAPATVEKWVIVAASPDDANDHAWWFDVESGKFEAIDGFSAGFLESVVATEDRGFLVLSRDHLEYTIQDGLQRYDAMGQRSWERKEPGYGQGMSFQSATCLTDGRVVAITSVTNTIEFFERDGKHERSVKLKNVLQKNPNYPSVVHADLDGGFILHDFNGSPPIYRIDKNDKVIASFQPRFEDGRTFRIYDGVKVAPDGRLWTSDFHSLLRLNNDGVVDLVLGRQPGDDSLEKVLALTIDHHQNIYAVNERTAAVHVFDKNGSLLRICHPNPDDWPTDSGVGHITVDGEGNMYYNTGTYKRHGFLRFTPACENLGLQRFRMGSVSEDWLFHPGSQRRWHIGYESIWLVDDEGDKLLEIERRPNNDWLEVTGHAAVAPNGALAVIAGPMGMVYHGPVTANIYAADGAPINTIPLPGVSSIARVAFNGETIVIVDSGRIFLFDADGSNAREFKPAAEDEGEFWMPYFSADGRELWLQGARDARLERFSMHDR